MARRSGPARPILLNTAPAPADRRPAPAADAQGRPWYRIYDRGVAVANASSTRIDIYEEIGGWGVSASRFVEQLRDVTGPNIDLHINSPGGSVFDGVAIYNALAQHPATVTAYVDGLAASAASFIAQAADRIVMNPGSMMMVHDAIAMTWGNRFDHRTTAELLEQVSGSIASLYAARAGGTPEDWAAVMENNGGEGRWYTAREAVDVGLADAVAGDPEPDDSVGEPTPDNAPADEAPVDRFDRSSIAAGHRLVLAQRDMALASPPVASTPVEIAGWWTDQASADDRPLINW